MTELLLHSYSSFYESHKDEVYELYSRLYPEEINSDFIIDEDGNPDYILDILRSLYMDLMSDTMKEWMSDARKEFIPKKGGDE